MADTQRLEGKIDALRDDLQSLRVLIAAMMPRAEVESAVAQRVLVETYTSDQREVNARLTRLEASPNRFLSWLSGGVGCLGLVMSAAMGAFFILEFVLTHYKP